MAGSIAKLVVSLGANVAGFETDMKRATRQQKKRMQQMEADVKRFGKAFGIALAGAATGLGAIITSTAKTADQTQKMAQRLGTSTEALSELSHVAELSGVQFNQLTIGMQRMERRIAEVAALGKGEAKQALEQLGLSAKELIDLPVDQQFERIAEELSKIPNDAERVRVAFKLFDSEGVALVQTMGEGAEGIRAMRQEARDLGKVISTDTANAAVAFNDNMTRLTARFDAFKLSITEGALPALLDIQDIMLESSSSMNKAGDSAGVLDGIIRTLAAAFIIVKNAALGFGKVLLGVLQALAGVGQAVLAPFTAAVGALIDAFARLKAGDLAGAAAALKGIGSDIAAEFESAVDRIETAGGFIVETVSNIDDGLDDAARAFQRVDRDAKKAAGGMKKAGDSADAAAKKTGKLTTQQEKLNYQWKLAQEAAKKSNAELSESIGIFDALVAEQEEYEQSLQGILDQLYPVEAAGRELGQTLDILTRALEAGDLSWEQYQDAVQKTTDEFNNAVTGAEQAGTAIDALAEAQKEAARIMERTFTDLFTSIVDDSIDAWGAIESGFQALIANMLQAASRGITIQISQALAPGGPGLSSLSLSGQFGQDLLAAIGTIIGVGTADTIFGQAGAALGQLFGKAAFSALFPNLFSALGSWAGPIGTAVGAILGSILGDALGNILARDLEFTLGGPDVAAAADAQRIRTALGGVVGVRGQGGFGDLRDPSTFGGQLGNAIEEFDKQIAEILKATVTDEVFQSVLDSLTNWQGTWGEGADAIDVLSSRFRNILSNFDADIQQFVLSAEDFEEQVERFGAALAVDKLVRENPDFFAGRVTGEILAIVEAFKSVGGTFEEAFQEFANVAATVVSVLDALSAYAGSDLEADFAALNTEIPLIQAVAEVQSALLDAIAGFDGSIEALTDIGNLSIAVREGELKLLAEIDSIQKGIEASLASLRDQILGITAEPLTGEELFAQAQALLESIELAVTPQEIADLTQQFEALIRQMSAEDQAAMQSELVSLIDTFQASASAALEGMRADAIANATAVREAVDNFVTEIGDPLDVIAASLEGQNIPEVIDDGLDKMNQTIERIGPEVASAIRQGVSDINVNVVISSDVVTE